jgi:hypothetical protein
MKINQVKIEQQVSAYFNNSAVTQKFCQKCQRPQNLGLYVKVNLSVKRPEVSNIHLTLTHTEILYKSRNKG